MPHIECTSEKVTRKSNLPQARFSSVPTEVAINRVFQKSSGSYADHLKNCFYNSMSSNSVLYKFGTPILQDVSPGYHQKSINTGMFLFCPSCMKRSHAKPLMDESLKAISVQCGVCQKEYQAEELLVVDGAGSRNGHRGARDFKVSVNGDKMSVSFSVVYPTIFKERLQYNVAYGRVVLNIKTGQSYQLPYWKNNKVSNDFFPKKISNITYNDYLHGADLSFITKDEKREIYDTFVSLKSKHINFSLGDYASHSRDGLSIEKESGNAFFATLINMNRACYMPPELLNSLFQKDIYGSSSRRISYLKDIPVHSDSPYKETLNALGVPYKKSYAKILMEDPSMVLVFYRFSKHFKDPNTYLALSSSETLIRAMKRNGQGKGGTDFYNFMKSWLRSSKESVVAKKILSSPSYFFDTFEMFKSIKTHDNSYKMDFSGNIKEIHNRIMKDFKEIRHKPVPFKYSDKEIKKMSKTYGGYKFSLATNSLELTQTGRTMNICVGGYKDRVLKKSCHIVILRDGEGEEKACIELNRTKTKIIQAKERFNQLPSGKIYDLIMDWAKDVELDIDTRDLEPALLTA